MSDQDFAGASGRVAVGIGDFDDDYLDDDDDDDPGANVQHWVGQNGGGQNAAPDPMDRFTPSQLKQLAGGDPDARAALAGHQRNVLTGPMVQRSRWKKKGAAGTAAVAGVAGFGVGTANTLTGGAILGGATLSSATGWAAVAGGGVSLLGGPFALLAAGTALSLGGSVRQGRATYKTNKHIQNLESILAMAARDEMHCSHRTSPDHSNIVHVVLPYIIHQKKKKRVRKAARMLPMLGNIETARSMMHKTVKLATRVNGNKRGIKAEQLALHHVQTDYAVTKAIIAELFSVDMAVAEEARYLDSTLLAKLLERKMKSV